MANLNVNNNEHEYRKRFKNYMNKTDQITKLDEILSEILPPLLESDGYELNQQKDVNVLSIGSGHGKTDLAILKILDEAIERLKELQGVAGPIRIFNRAIEPNDKFLKEYEKKSHSFIGKQHFVIDLRPPQTFEKYALEPKDDVKFDIVHLVHCLYYIDVEQALVHCYNTELKEKGMIMICVAGSNNLMNSIERHDKTLGYPRFEFMNKTITSVLEKHPWKFTEYTENHEYDVSDVFDEDSEEGNLLLDFLLFKVDFRSKSHPEDVKKYLDLIKKYCTLKDGKFFAKMEQRIVIIFK